MMEGAADVAEITCTPFASQPGAAPVRLRPSASPPAEVGAATYSYHDRQGDTLATPLT